MSHSTLFDLQKSTARSSLVEKMCFSPIRFCGRQWEWIRGENTQISQLAVRALATPFFLCAAALSIIPAIAGAFIFTPITCKSEVLYGPGGDITLTRKNLTNEHIAQRIAESIGEVRSICSVTVESTEREYSPTHYPEHISRYVTLKSSSNRVWNHFFEVIRGHFYNEAPISITSLYRCIYGQGEIANLKRALRLCQSIKFYLPVDLAYVKTTIQ